MRRLLLAIAAAVLLLPAGLAATPAQAETPARAASCGFADQHVWYATTIFNGDDCFSTPGGILYMQADGNLVLFDGHGNFKWASNTGGKWGAHAAFQDDGNFVVYWWPGGPSLWESRTAGNHGARLILTGTGQLVIKLGPYVIWRRG